ncbi:MAG: NTP transferase domain-containing protein [Syntrophobacterales bacterium]|jgi:bifunctional UDP-N-acetylglucosamine pyrophosphorylase/glucosamine-1-phosphate N-acetyltransferase
MNNVVALVLAAGKGTRMYSDLAKVLHPICGRPMLAYALAAVQQLGLARILVVVGHQAERIQEVFAGSPVEWVLQTEQLGTAHAVQCALPHLTDHGGSVLICCGDTPLLTAETLRMFQVEHMNRGADLSVLSMLLDEPGSYGRVVRDSGGEVSAIIEAKDANEQERTIREVNTGIYCASADLLRAVLPDVENANVQGEYYLTDLVQMSAKRGWNVQAVTASDPIEFLGVNTNEELEAAERVIAQRMEQPTADRP